MIPNSIGRNSVALTGSAAVIRDNYFGTNKLFGRVALIGGGDSDIGRSVAVHFAREGAAVAIAYANDDVGAGETAALVEAEGAEALLLKGDTRDRAFCRAAVQQTLDRFGMLDILVNNAAEQELREVVGTIERQREEIYRAHVCGYIHMTEAALEHLSDKGCIINTGSMAGVRGDDIAPDDAATKGAIRALTYSLARQVVARGIRVNGVAAGPVWSWPLLATRSNIDLMKFGSNTPMRRAAQPCEIGPAYVFLASEDASYITGQFIHINGGSYMA